MGRDHVLFSKATPNSFSSSAAALIVFQSETLPMMRPTLGPDFFALLVPGFFAMSAY